MKYLTGLHEAWGSIHIKPGVVCTPVISVLGSRRLEDQEFRIILGLRETPSQRKTRTTKKTPVPDGFFG